MQSEQVLKEAIKHALDSFNYTTALFLSERLVCQSPDPQSYYLLSKTYYLLDQKSQVLLHIDPTNCTSQAMILYAQSCLDLQKLKVGDVSIRKWLEGHGDAKPLDLAVIYSLLGLICKY